MKGFIEVQTKIYNDSSQKWILNHENELINISSISRVGDGWITLKEFSYDNPITIHVNHSFNEIKHKIFESNY